MPDHSIKDGRLFRRYKGMPVEVVFEPRCQLDILRLLHKELSHRGQDKLFRRVSLRFWWPNLMGTIRDHVRLCLTCQLRTQRREVEEHWPTSVTCVFQKVALDVVNMSAQAGLTCYLLVACDNLSGWVEAHALKNITSQNTAKFLFEDLISRFGPIGFLVTDNSPEFRGAFEYTAAKYNIPLVCSLLYNPIGNAMVEQGHAALAESIVKATGRENLTKWWKHLHAALWADRITTKRTLGYSPFELVYRSKPVLPLNVTFSTWLGLAWDKVKTTADLLTLRLCQLKRHKEDVWKASILVKDACQASVTYLDTRSASRLREPLPAGALVPAPVLSQQAVGEEVLSPLVWSLPRCQADAQLNLPP